MTEQERISKLDELGVRLDQFIIAINGAAIAYALRLLEDFAAKPCIAILGISIVSWGISFYCGVSSIRRLLSARIIDIFSGRNIVSQNLDVYTKVRGKFKEIGDLANSLNNRMYFFFYTGCIFFVFWQALEIYNRYYCICNSILTKILI